ncbi:alpha/beta hydrolase [Stigmatella aurantiaca]|uniref:Esterase/lipase/thioesterase n=1 Tax=Stigmatella aurantiaca (strain DW4/3-1) TaxID=378806 RepID=Q08WG9_STIAD|nr:alpha/beta hydrolase [Stigmatella aurantiaca]ADO69814.1 Hydrolase, alpha/beta fold family [Stigmatella aurantiaca DW4/3-1]EAU64829.1 esterase/lipase/thioesterase [Stigmatella aurantiaca DW4/3-1]
MSSRHLVDPELHPFIEQWSEIKPTRETLPRMRLELARGLEKGAPPTLPRDVEVSERWVPGPPGAPEVRVLVYRPKRKSPGAWPALLHMHPGGYIIGSPEMNDVSNRRLASRVGCVIVSVDYRLAPETPFPGPVEDCYAALRWLHANAAQLGVDASRLAIGGESAGGGLAAALGLMLRDRGDVPVIFQVLIYPMIDDRTAAGVDPAPHVGAFFWTRASNRFGWKCLLGQKPGGADVSPYAAPARAHSLAGLPPTLMCVGALDLFMEETVEYARRLLAEGVPTELHVYPRAVHAFNLVEQTQVAQSFLRDYEQALRRALYPSGAPPDTGRTAKKSAAKKATRRPSPRKRSR